MIPCAGVAESPPTPPPATPCPRTDIRLFILLLYPLFLGGLLCVYVFTPMGPFTFPSYSCNFLFLIVARLPSFFIIACTPVRYIHLGPHGTRTPVQPSLTFLPLKRRRRYMAYPTCTDLVYSNHHYNYLKHPLFELALRLGAIRWRAEWSKRDFGCYMGHWLGYDDVMDVSLHKCPW